jgi:hypothetical protein
VTTTTNVGTQEAKAQVVLDPNQSAQNRSLGATTTDPNWDAKVLDLIHWFLKRLTGPRPSYSLVAFVPKWSHLKYWTFAKEWSIYHSNFNYSVVTTLFQDWGLRCLNLGGQQGSSSGVFECWSPHFLYCSFSYWVPNRYSSWVYCSKTSPGLEWWFLSSSWLFEWPENCLFQYMSSYSYWLGVFPMFLNLFKYLPREKAQGITLSQLSLLSLQIFLLKSRSHLTVFPIHFGYFGLSSDIP